MIGSPPNPRPFPFAGIGPVFPAAAMGPRIGVETMNGYDQHRDASDVDEIDLAAADRRFADYLRRNPESPAAVEYRRRRRVNREPRRDFWANPDGSDA